MFVLGCGRNFQKKLVLALTAVLSLATLVVAQDAPARIPSIGFDMGIGEPPAHPGHGKAQGNFMIDDGYFNGAPVGGFGAGSIGRTYRGDFARYHLKIGVHKYETVPSNQFALFAESNGKRYAQALWTGKPGTLQSWKWNYPVGGGRYHSLYPKAWTRYKNPEMPIIAMVEQFSPILPNNYKETSYPVAVYNWTLENPTNQEVKVSVLFSWANMVGWFRDFRHDLSGQDSVENFDQVKSEQTPLGAMKGVVFGRHRMGSVHEEWDGQFAIAAPELPGVSITTRATYNPNGDGSEIWKTFSENGTLDNGGTNFTSSGEPLAGAIAVSVTLKPGETRVIPIVLAWDLPIVQFGQGTKWFKRYTAFFGKSGENAWAIARTALLQDKQWSEEIDKWQAPYIADTSTPDWYRGELFNEMYYLADGGTFWDNGRVDGTAEDRAHFTYMECFDYPYYSTLDVGFYGSMPLIKWWPDLDKASMRDFAKSVPQNLSMVRKIAWSGAFAPRKSPGALPHDLGAPNENPILEVNQYNYQNVNDWKDLNTKYVLLVWRDFALTGHSDAQFLRDNWTGVKQAMEYLPKFDHDGDGIPDNDGIPDQTYDNWPARGDSAYCGSLWLAALRATVAMGKVLHDQEAVTRYQAWYDKAQPNFIKKLWNGNYFNYDTDSSYKTNVMADQLAGQWYAELTGLERIVPEDSARKALATIFRLNVMGFQGGHMGALNGMGPDGAILKDNEQTEEVWGGVTYGLSSFLVLEGMKEEGFTTAHGVHEVIVDRGYWFRTPEAWNRAGEYRASMYMRLGAIWAIDLALHPAEGIAKSESRTAAHAEGNQK
jgi:non-lysosomal glucosylceramidase